MSQREKIVVWLIIIGAFAWWFFMGDTPVQVGRGFFGRGRRLTSSTLNPDGSLKESPEDLQQQVQVALGRSVSLDAVLLARVSASEHYGAAEREKSAIQWVCRNDAAAHGWSIRTAVTVNPGTLGKQAGRRYSTAGGGLAGIKEIHEDDLWIAEGILGGTIPDLTYGATKFVHYTAYKSFVDFLEGNPKVQKWIDEGGLAPVFLGDVSTLVVFLPAEQVSADGRPLAAGVS